MVTYDPRVVREFADRLYRRARFVVALYTGVSILAGLILGVAVGQFLATTGGVQGIPAALLALVFGVLGFVRGRERVFALKLQAQTALCQVQIEENTRRQ